MWLTRALLALPLLAAPVAARAAEPACDTPFFVLSLDLATLELKEGPGREALRAHDPACAGARGYRADHRRLLRAAGIGEGELPLAVYHLEFFVTPAVYLRGRRAIGLKDASLRNGVPRSEMLVAMAHEIGHAIQERRNERFHTRRQLEGHADAIGMELLHRAGYPAWTGRRGFENLIGCGALQGEPSSGGSHPAYRDRWRNAVAATAALRALDAARPASFDGAGARGGYAPEFRPGDVRVDGRVDPSGVLERARRRTRVAARPRASFGVGAGLSRPERGRVVLSVPIPVVPTLLRVDLAVDRRFLSPGEHRRARAARRYLASARARLGALLDPRGLGKSIASLCRTHPAASRLAD